MKQWSIGNGFVRVACVGTLLFASARAQYAQVTPTSPAASAAPETQQGDSALPNAASAKSDKGKSERSPAGAAELSPGVGDVLKMAKAGVSAEVIKTFIEHSPIAYSLSATDIIALKNNSIPDDLTTAMVKRGTALQTQATQSSNLSALPLAAAPGGSHSATFDPEGYDYFHYYYLYPRTLAAANQRLYSPYTTFPPFPSYAFGLYGPGAFHPLPPSVFRRP
jgi:hypothetical protein